MVETSPIPAARPGAAASTPTLAQAAGAADDDGTIASDFETFLKLLTTQMRNQDPLKPLESTEFVAQLATFSAVEQQVASNKRLESIEGLLAGGAAGLAAWLGAEVEAPMALSWDGAPVQVRVDPNARAERAYLTVRDAEGVIVNREAVEPDLSELVWTGAGGVSGGKHSFEVEYWAGDEQLEVVQGRVFSTVTEARPGESGARLILAGGVEIAESDVTAVRAAD
ncbi:flagellar hook capping FlgD N-terminal domain-containing protein [Rhodovulum sp. DZ06]|uniref:flagellar hook capping FlgD N-terminal domain-containing protein n=1 Tax=Rhodovulum sp. DZ06 TaxID=3425126 RepID=UPI003D33F4A9